MSESKPDPFRSHVIHVHPRMADLCGKTLVFLNMLDSNKSCGRCQDKKPTSYRPLDGMLTKSGG